MSKRYVRRHPTGHMKGLGELRGITEPAAVVLRPDGSIDYYGPVAIVDQAAEQADAPDRCTECGRTNLQVWVNFDKHDPVSIIRALEDACDRDALLTAARGIVLAAEGGK